MIIPTTKSIDTTYKWLSVKDFGKIDTILTRDVFFKIPRICGQIMGTWPGDIIETKFQYCLPILTLGIILLCSFTQWGYAYAHLNSVYDLLSVVIPSSTLTVSLVKALLLLLVRKEIHGIMYILHYEWYIGEYAKKYEKNNLNMAKWAQLLSLSVFLSTLCFVIFTSVAPIIVICYQFATGQPIIRRMGFVSE